jgi:hypothetical protein
MAEQPTTYGIDVITRLLNLTEQRVHQLVKAGIIPRADRGQYQLAPTVAAYVRYLQEQVQARGKPAEQQSRLALRSEQQRRLKLENDEREGRLIPFDHAQAITDEIAATFVMCLEALPGRLAGELAGMDQPSLIRGRLKAEVYAIRTQVADRIEKLARLGRKGGKRRKAATA